MEINQDKLNEFMGRALVDFGATLHAGLVIIGEKLGLYKALDEGGPQTPAELARRTNTTERYVREWLNAHAAGGYVMYDADRGSQKEEPSARGASRTDRRTDALRPRFRRGDDPPLWTLDRPPRLLSE
jgi:hypothetical protein